MIRKKGDGDEEADLNKAILDSIQDQRTRTGHVTYDEPRAAGV